MSKKTQKNIMKAVGATFAVCSAVALIGSQKSSMSSTKKTMKKTADKVFDFMDTVTSVM